MSCFVFAVSSFVWLLMNAESDFQISEYIGLTFGESRTAKTFKRLFLEKRSKWLDLKDASPKYDPASAVSPEAVAFQGIKVCQMTAANVCSQFNM